MYSVMDYVMPDWLKNSKWYIMNEKKQPVDVISFIENFLLDNPDSDIIIGTDSQNRGDSTVYVSACVLVYPNNKGSRVLYTKELIPRVRVVFDRLRYEAERSLQVAEYLLKNDLLVTHIELDFQNKNGKNTKSKSVFQAYEGWVKSIGCEVLGKSDEDSKEYVVLQAIAAADKLAK